MGYWNDDGEWMEGNPAPVSARPRPRQMRPASERQNDPNPGVRRQARTELRQGGWDDDGNPIAPAPANLGETVDDAWRSAVSGAQQGFAGLLGLPGDLAGAVSRATDGEEDGPADRAGFSVGWSPMGPMILPGAEPINNAIEQTFGEQHEPETTPGEYARTAGRWAPQAIFPGGPAARASRVLVPSALEETAGQLTEGTEAEPYARLIAGLGGAIVNEGFISVLTRQGLTPDERSLRLIMREMQDQGMTPDEIVRQANVLTRQAPTEEVVAEVLGEGGLRMARAVAAMGRGSGRQIAEDALSVRAEGGRIAAPTPRSPNATREVTGIRDRVMDEASAMTAPQQNRSPRNYWDALDALRTARSGQGADAYRSMYAQAPDPAAVQQQILPYMAEGSVEAAASGARQLRSVAEGLRAQVAAAQARGADPADLQRLADDLADVSTAIRQLEGVASRQMPNTLSSRAIDYYQRGLGQLERAAGMGSPEARALGDARRAFNTMADEVVPGFRDARTRYGDSMRIEETMNHGRRVFDMSEGEIERVMRGSNGQGLTMEEFDGFMLGVMDAIERKLGQGDTAFLARLMRNDNWRNQVTRAVGGEANARRFFNRLAREASMQRTRNFVQSGSRTQPLKEDIAALTDGEAELAFLADRQLRGIAAGLKAGNPWEAMMRTATWIYDRTNRPGIANPQVQEALARRLFTRVTRRSARQLRDDLNALEQAGNRMHPELRDWMGRVLAADSATTEARLENGEEPAATDDADTLRQAYMEMRDAANAPAGEAMTIIDGAAEHTIVESNGRFYVGSRGFDTMPEAEAYARFLAARSGE